MFKIQWNNKYTTISLYTFIVFVSSILFHRIISNWSTTLQTVQMFLKLISPFFIGFLITFLLNPGVKWFETLYKFNLFKKRDKFIHSKKPRSLAIITMYIIVFGFISIMMIYVIPELYQSITTIPDTFKKLSEETLSISTIPYLNIDINSIFEYIENSVYELLSLSEDQSESFILNEMIPTLFNASRSFTSGILDIFLGIVISVYIIYDQERFLYQVKKLTYAIIPSGRAEKIIHIASESNEIFKKFFIGKALDSLIIGFICFIGMRLLNFNYPLLISVIVGITNMIPYFGPIIGAVPGFIIIFILNPLQAVWFMIYILALQQFDGNILGPKILGDAVGLSPFWIIFAIIIGGGLFGILGMFLGVPIFAVIYNLIRRLVDQLLINKDEETRSKANKIKEI